MRLRFLIIIFISICINTFSTRAQNYDKSYFRPPLDIPLKLVGNFGELRPNHFHSGIDLKVPYSGIKLFAAADGYVSRIKKSPVGYGNALYITHPNGLMTVYGHMKKFNEVLEKYSKNIQYENNQFDFTVYPDSTKFKVKKGDLIGYAGNTGRSYGPHLHFEIREAEKDIPINPLYFNFNIKDNIKPVLYGLIAYPVDNGSKVNGSSRKQKFKLIRNRSNYYIKNIIKFEGKIGFAFKAYDYVNGSKNSQGVYSVKMFLDDSLVYSHKTDRISFYETRYLNSFTDYEERQISNNKYQKCFIDPGNKLSIYNFHKNRGLIELNDKKTHRVKIEVSDIKGNKSTINIKLSGSTVINENKQNTNELFFYNKDNYFVKEDFRAYIRKGSLYKDVGIKYSVIPKESGLYSDIHKLNSYLIPVHENMHIAISTKHVPKKLLGKALIVYINKRNKYEPLGGYYINGFIAAKSKNFGKYAITTDQKAPRIVLETNSTGSDYSKMKKISLKITDDLSGIDKYFADIDGKPIIFEYDEKNDRISYTFDNKIEKNKNHVLKIEVIDKKNNKSVFQTIFFK